MAALAAAAWMLVIGLAVSLLSGAPSSLIEAVMNHLEALVN